MIIPASNITHIQYTQLGHDIWCVTAKVSESLACLNINSTLYASVRSLSSGPLCTDLTNLSDCKWYYVSLQKPTSKRSMARRQREQQRQSVRHLLQNLLKRLDIEDTLDESSFPYRLINSKYYVCFSHTGAHNKNHSNSNKTSSSQIALVISHHRPAGIDIEHNNVAWHVAQRFYSDNEIAVLQTLLTNKCDSMAKLLWQIKESFIKVHQYTLAQGLGMDYSDVIPALTDDMNKDLITISHTNDQSNHQIAVLQADQTVVVF